MYREKIVLRNGGNRVTVEGRHQLAATSALPCAALRPPQKLLEAAAGPTSLRVLSSELSLRRRPGRGLVGVLGRLAGFDDEANMAWSSDAGAAPAGRATPVLFCSASRMRLTSVAESWVRLSVRTSSVSDALATLSCDSCARRPAMIESRSESSDSSAVICSAMSAESVW